MQSEIKRFCFFLALLFIALVRIFYSSPYFVRESSSLIQSIEIENKFGDHEGDSGDQFFQATSLPDNSFERQASGLRIIVISRQISDSYLFKAITDQNKTRLCVFDMCIIQSFFNAYKSQRGYYTFGLMKLRF